MATYQHSIKNLIILLLVGILGNDVAGQWSNYCSAFNESPYVWSSVMCTDGEYSISWPSPIPGATYTWNITNGTLLSGQGTATIRVRANTTSTRFWGGSATTYPNPLGVSLYEQVPGGPPYQLESCVYEVYEVYPEFTGSVPLTICDTNQSYAYSVINHGYLIPTPSIFQYLSFSGFNMDSSRSELDVPFTYDETNYYWGKWGKGGMGYLEVTGYHTYAYCGDVIRYNINLFPDPQIQGPDQVCVGDTIQYFTSPHGGKTWLWDIMGGQVVSGLTSNTVSVRWDSLGTRFLRVQEHNGGCGVWDTFYVNIDTSFFFEIGDDTLCPFARDTVFGPSGMGSYLWSDGSTNPYWYRPDSGTKTLEIVTTGGCVASDTFEITVLPGDKVDLGPDTTQCSRQPITLFATPNHPGTTFRWFTYAWFNRPDSFIVSSPGMVQVRMTDSLGCRSWDTIRVQMSPNSIAPTTFLQCWANPDTLFANSTGSNYLWSTGDTVSWVIPDTSGNYFIQMTDTLGCTLYDTVQVTVDSLPVFSLGNDTTLCNPGHILRAPQGNYSYQWYYDGIYYAGNVDTLVVLYPGNYWVRVFSNSCEQSDLIQISFSTLPSNIFPPSYATCGATSLTLNGIAGASHLWSTGDTTASLNVTSGGTYWVEATGPGGCTVSDTVQVIVTLGPNVSLGNDTIICNPGGVMLQPSGNFASYLWSNGNTSNSIQVTQPGHYAITITDSLGCNALDTIYVDKDHTDPIPDDTSFCQGLLVTIPVSPDMFFYTWGNGIQNMPITISQSGVYTIQGLTYEGCVMADTLVAFAFPAPLTNLGPDTTVCSDNLPQLDAGYGFDSYLWSTGSTSRMIWPSTSGIYSVTVTQTGYNCPGIDSVRVVVLPIPDPSFNWSFQGGGTYAYQFTQTTTSPQDSFLWTFGDGTTSRDTNPVHNFPMAAPYNVCLRSYNSCGVRADCDQISALVSSENSRDTGFVLYPNPATTGITISSALPSSGQKKVFIYNYLGNLVSFKDWPPGQSKLDIPVHALAQGMYNIVVQEGKSVWIREFLVER